jgi:hypothetical protein
MAAAKTVSARIPSPGEVQRALDKIDAATSKVVAARSASREFDLDEAIKDICKTYRQIRPAIDKALDLIESLGSIFGYDFKRIASSIRRVMGLIETLCV